MMNQIIILGRIDNIPEVTEFETEKVANITVAIPRSYKNAGGGYGVDVVDCTLWNTIAQSTVDYCRKDDLVAIKAHFQTKDNTKETEIIVDKISFLTSKE